MILTTELPQELLQALREAPLRLNAMRSALLAANLEGVWWGLRCITLSPRYTELVWTMLNRWYRAQNGYARRPGYTRSRNGSLARRDAQGGSLPLLLPLHRFAGRCGDRECL